MGQRRQRRVQGGQPHSESGIGLLESSNLAGLPHLAQTTCLKIFFGHDPPHVIPVRSYNGIC